MRQIVVGTVLVAATLAMVLAWEGNGRNDWWLILPALVGAVMLCRARWGVMVFDLDRRALVVTRRGFLAGRDVSIPLGDVATVEVRSNSLSQGEQQPDYLLLLARRQDAPVVLLRGGTAAALEGDRDRIAGFMREHSLLWGGDEAAAGPRDPVEPAGPLRRA